MSIAFITGVTGMDGSLLADFLLEKGYEVHGLVRQSTQFTPDKYGHLRGAMKNTNFQVHYGDLTDAMRLRDLIKDTRPDEVYNLAAQSHVGMSFEQPTNTADVTAMGALNVLEAIRKSGVGSRFYNAGSSEMFGKVRETPQNELTPFHPRSPYGCSKAFAYYTTQNYREAYDMFAVSGILYNHEHSRRGENFVTRKITRAVGRILSGQQQKLELGNISAKRDWGYAPDYVKAMWMMLQRSKPEDFVIGTGEMHSVEQFLDAAFDVVGLRARDYTIVSVPKHERPSEVETLCADASKAKRELGWQPSISFKQLVEQMVLHDVKLAEQEAHPVKWLGRTIRPEVTFSDD